MLPRIFEAFEQYHDDLRGRSGGLGLGLAISRSLAEAFGGRLVASSRGRGPARPFASSWRRCPPRPSGGRRDLYRLDRRRNPSRLAGPTCASWWLTTTPIRCGTWRRSCQRGHEVVTADCVASARAAVNEAKVPFDLLLSDIELPDGDGMNLMRELSARGRIAGIAVSGFGAEEDRRLSREAGFVEHLTKPVDLGSLDAAIKRAIRLRAEHVRGIAGASETRRTSRSGFHRDWSNAWI